MGASSVAALPDGFVLDEQPVVPDGFVLDAAPPKPALLPTEPGGVLHAISGAPAALEAAGRMGLGMAGTAAGALYGGAKAIPDLWRGNGEAAASKVTEAMQAGAEALTPSRTVFGPTASFDEGLAHVFEAARSGLGYLGEKVAPKTPIGLVTGMSPELGRTIGEYAFDAPAAAAPFAMLRGAIPRRAPRPPVRIDQPPPIELAPPSEPVIRPPEAPRPIELEREGAPVFTPPRPDVSEPAGRIPVAPDWEIASGAPREVRRGFDEPPIEPTEAGITQLVGKVLKEQPQAHFKEGIARTVEDVARESGVPVRVEPRVEALPYGPPDATPAARTAERVAGETNAMRPNVPMDILKTLDTVARESNLPRTVRPRITEPGTENVKTQESPVARGRAGVPPPDGGIFGSDGQVARGAGRAAEPVGGRIPPAVERPGEALDAVAEAEARAFVKTEAARVKAEQKAPKVQSLLAAIKEEGGLNIRDIRDLTGENRTGREGIPVGLFRKPGAGGDAGPKNRGFGLDDMVVRLRERGFNIPDDRVDGGVGALLDMVRKEVNGEKVYAGGDAERVYEHEAVKRAADEESAHNDRMANDPEYRADYERAQEEGAAPDDWSKLTEEQKNAELDRRFNEANDAAREGDVEETVGRRERQPGEDDELELTRPTEAGLRAKDAESQRAAAEQRRVEAAPPPEDFRLSGSDRAADEARAAGQQELPGGEPKTGTGGKLYAGPPLEEMLAFGKEVAGRTLGPWRDWKAAGLKMTAAAEAVADAFGAKVKGVLSRDAAPAGGESVTGAISRALFYNVHSHIKSFGGSWNSPTVGKIADMIYSTAGKAQEGQSFHEALGAHIALRQRPLSEIAVALNKLTDAKISDNQIIRQVEHPEARQGEIGRQAKRIADWLAEERAYQKEAGADIGERANYFPRQYDRSTIIPRRADFVADATRAYETDGLSRADAEHAAEAFWYRKAYGSEGSPSFKASGGKEAFVKARELSDAAAEHLRSWRVAGVMDTLNGYLMLSARRAEIARRFGDRWSRWDGLEREIIKEAPGITPEALRELRAMTASAMGLRAQSMGVAVHTGAQYLRLWTTLSTMPKSAMSSIAETWMPMIRANGDLAVTVNHLRNTLYEGSRSLLKQALTGERTEHMQRLFDYGEDIGALSQSPFSHVMADRWMGGEADSKSVSAVTSKFFRLNLLEQLTNWQRAIGVDAAQIWLRRLAKNAQGDKTGLMGGKKSASFFLRELGVPEVKLGAFTEYVRKMGDELPDAGDLTGEHGAAYRNAITRFVQQSIQNPNAATRPSWANTDWGAVVFQLQGFNNAFHKNVLLRQANLLKEGAKGDYTAAERAALMGGMIPGLMLSAATAGLVWEARDRIYNKEPKERTVQAKVERAISAAALTGAVDPYLQMIGGIRYQRSPAAAAGGPSFGAVDAGITTLAQLVMNNSDKTNSAERRGWDTFYAWGIEPAATLLLAASPAPVSPLTQALTVVALPASRQNFVDAVAGPKAKKKQKPLRGVFESKD